MRFFCAFALLLSALPSIARAEHQHGAAPATSEGATSHVGASLALVGASYETRLYRGDYQGVIPTLDASYGRFGLAAILPAYRLVRNGLTNYGVGDTMLHGQATLRATSTSALGVVFGLCLPSGDERRGFGMGHAMVMPALFGSTRLGHATLAASAGYARAIAGAADHEHGAWPLVDPMNREEATFSASADLHLTGPWRAGARFVGAVAWSDAGTSRLATGARAAHVQGRFETSLELQAGLVGDPFRLRGIVQSAVRF